MWNKPTEQQLTALPALYATEDVEEREKIIVMHFFLCGSDWYAVEYSPDEQIFFGFVILNEDMLNAEWGYFSLPELAAQRFSDMEIDRDVYWKTRPAADVEKISKALGWGS